MIDALKDTGKGETAVSCEDLTVAYGDDVILRGVSFDVPRGAFLPFIGPNGAGKTTLLRAILGLIRPRSGRVITGFGGKPPGYVPQHKSIDPLYPVSVGEIVMMGLYPKCGFFRRPGVAERKAVDEALERFGMAEHRSKNFSELSGGMKQRTILARAFVTGADVFVMDEPTLELDGKSADETMEYLASLSRDEGRTVLLAGHRFDRLPGFAGVVCLVDQGCVRMAGVDELSGVPSFTGINEGGSGHAR